MKEKNSVFPWWKLISILLHILLKIVYCVLSINVLELQDINIISPIPAMKKLILTMKEIKIITKRRREARWRRSSRLR